MLEVQFANLYVLAEEVATEGSNSHIIELSVVISTIALTIVTFALTWATYLVHRDTIKGLTHDNDNMHDIAEKEIENRHIEELRKLRKLQTVRKVK